MAVLPNGKLPADLLRELLEQESPPELVLPPRLGEDACAIELPPGLLVAAADPITLTGSQIGAHAVRINANDVAVAGARPRWFMATLLLPSGSNDHEVREIFAGMRHALAELGAVLVGGHTEVTAAVNQPVLSGQMLGVAERALPTGGARDGDRLIQVGPAPVEGAAVMASEAPAALAGLSDELAEAARHALDDPGISVVEAALRSAALGASALHDPTEGGLSAGIYELAEASGQAIELDSDAILWFEAGTALCDALGADRWGTLASGCLLATFPVDLAEAAQTELVAAGNLVAQIGRVRSGRGVSLDGAPLPRHERDELSRVLC